MKLLIGMLLIVLWSGNLANAGSAVVSNGRFTTVYVYPDPDRETWEQHMAALRPMDAAHFSRASIDKFTAELMKPQWPSYFDGLMQYNQIHPPQFFGSAVASKVCVDAALRDMSTGLLQWDTIRSLSNCHENGMDPSPQIILVFSPDIKIASIDPLGHGSEICTAANTVNAWHAWGLNTPNFIAMPTSTACMPNFDTFTRAMSHEIVETISDPAGMGMGDFGQNELCDNCEHKADGFTTVNGFSLARYWSNRDKNCQPRLDPPPGSTNETWILGEASPLKRFTGDVHELTLGLPNSRATTTATLTQAIIVIQTGGDDLRGGSNPGDNCNATLNFASGSKQTVNLNQGGSWENGETHSAILALPSPAPRVSDITSVTITTHFGGGLSGDNWNVDKVALVVSFPTGSTVSAPSVPVVHQWLNASGNPLVRFTGHVHDQSENVPPQDVGKPVSHLELIISTGNDDLRGGSNPGDNCNVILTLASGRTITLNNVNRGHSLNNWTTLPVSIPLPPGGLQGGDVKSVSLHTGFGGGIGGDNWNVQRIQLEATLR